MTPTHTPDPAALDRVRHAVLSMPIARTLQLTFRRVEAGDVELQMPVLDAWCFQPGQLQASAVFAAADFAAVAAAGTLLPPGQVNATVDATLKLIAPARGTHLVARGRVIDAGRSQTVCAAEVHAVDATGRETLCATLLGTARHIDLSRAA